MKKMFALMLLIPALMMMRSAFAETMTPAPAKKGAPAFFEPKQADFDCCHVQIVAQQDAYISARDGKRWNEAHSLALFYFTRAWLFNNEAFDIIKKNQTDSNITDLKRAQDLLLSAREEIALAMTAGHHMSEVTLCEKRVNKNLDACAELIKKAIEADGE